MAEKILTIIFSGISTLHPNRPRYGSQPPDRAFVLMAANREIRTNEWNETIPIHSPFIYVPASVLAPNAPPPGDSVDDNVLGPCNLYFLDNARVEIDPPPMPGLQYFTDRKKMFERPGSSNEASEHDIRWLADFRDILSAKTVELKPDTTPTAASLSSELAAVVELTGGTFKANFPCKSVQPQTFQDVNHNVVPGINRVLASEFLIEMRYPANTSKVTLLVTPLRSDQPVTGLAGGALALKWPEEGDGTLVVRMGNDTQKEARLATSPTRCDARAKNDDGTPRLHPHDTDFDLHYDLLELSKGTPHFLPHANARQISVDGCKPGG